MPVMIYVNPATASPPFTNLTPVPVGETTSDITFPSDFGGFVVIDTAELRYGDMSWPDDIPSLDQMVALGLEFIQAGGTFSLHLHNDSEERETHLIRIFYYAFDGNTYNQTVSGDYYNCFNLNIDPVPTRYHISPSIRITQDKPTVYTLTMPYEYAGFIAIGDIDVPYTAGTDYNTLVNQCGVINPENSVQLAITERTRLRIFYFPALSYRGYYDPLDAYYDDLVLDVRAMPSVSVHNYGNNVSFEDQTTVILKASFPCNVTYRLLNIEAGMVSTVTLAIDDTLQAELTLYQSSTLTLSAEHNGLVMPDKFYYFKREARDSKSVYSIYLNDANNPVDNFDPSFKTFFASSAPNLYEYNGLQFSPLSNSIIVGRHWHSNPIVYYGNTYTTSSSTISTEPFYLRFHYKIVGYDYLYGGNGYVNITVNTAEKQYVIAESSNSEGWVTMLITGDGNGFSLQVDTYVPAGALSYCYTEISAISVWGKLLPIGVNTYNFCGPYSFDPVESIIVTSDAYGILDDSQTVLAVTTDGSIPTVNNSLPWHTDGWAYTCGISLESMASNGVLWQRDIIQGTTLQRSEGFKPLVGRERLSKLQMFAPYYNYDQVAVEDFKLGPFRYGWYDVNQDLSCDYSWTFTADGLRSPRMGAGSRSVASRDQVGPIDGKEIIIHYRIIPNTATGNFNGHFTVDISHATTSLTTDMTPGDHVLSVQLSSTFTDIQFTYWTNVFSFPLLSPYDQAVIVTSVEFVGKKKPIVNTFPNYLFYEDWSGGPNRLNWAFDGQWKYPDNLVALTDMVLVSPQIGNNDTTSFFVTMDCIDGNISFVWAASSELSYDLLNFYIDDEPQVSVSGLIDFRRVTLPVSLGTHTFKWTFSKDGSAAMGANCGMIKEISFPVLGGCVFDYDHADLVDILFTGDSWQWLSADAVYSPVLGYGTVVSEGVTGSITLQIPNDYIPQSQTDFLQLSFVCSVQPTNVSGSYDWVDTHMQISYSWSTEVTDIVLPSPYDLNSATGNFMTMNVPVAQITDGVITFLIQTNSGAGVRTVYLTDLGIASYNVEAVNLITQSVITSFPMDCELQLNVPNAQLFYTLDGTPPIVYDENWHNAPSPLAQLYSGPIHLTEPKLVLYAFYSPSTQNCGSIEAQIYTDEPILDAKIFYHTYKLNGTQYVKFYTVPWYMPMALCHLSNGELTYSVYNEQPIQVSGPATFVVGLLTFTGTYNASNFSSVHSINDLDLSSLQIIRVGDTVVEQWPRPISRTAAVLGEVASFVPTIVPSVPGGTYEAFYLQLRANGEGLILYSIDTDDLGSIYDEPVLIETSCTVYAAMSVEGKLSSTQQFKYSIGKREAEGAMAAVCKHTNAEINETTVCLRTGAVEHQYGISLFKTAVSYAGLIDNFTKTTYEYYVKYVSDNNVFTLFADEEMTKPFPFVFTMILNPGDYFSIPDTYAAVYLDGTRNNNFENDNLVCRFTDQFATGSTLCVVSDYCLRLCTDLLRSDRPNMVAKVWTNIPIGNYLSTGSSNVLLSVDGSNFARVIKLASNVLYVKGIVPSSAVYGYNDTSVVIKMATCEAIDEYSF